MPETLPVTSRNQVQQGIAAYFGGTLNTSNYAYMGGPLSGSPGVNAVRAGEPKRLNMNDAFAGSTPGVMSGAIMNVILGNDTEVRLGDGGPPTTDSSGNIITGGWKQICYMVTLDLYCISQQRYMEQATADFNTLVENVKQLIRLDRSLGMAPAVMDAGETKFGIKVTPGLMGLDENDRSGQYFSIQFEVRVNIIA